MLGQVWQYMLKTPNGKKIFLDCGSTSELSPACIINPSDDKKTSRLFSSKSPSCRSYF